MITPEYLSYMLDMLSVHKELEASILKDITRRILKSGFVTDTASYQAEKLNEAGLCYNEILDEISTRTKKCREEIKKSFSDAETKVFDYDESVLANAGINAHEFKRISPRMKRIITAALAKTATDAVNLTKTTANTTQSLYISACDLAHMQVMSGAFDYNTAVKNAVTHAAREGIKVVYPTGAVSSLDTAVRRSVLTGVNQTFAKITEMRAKEFDVDLMLTSAHIGARPEHAVWQGYVVSLSGRDGYLTLSDVGYGDVRGIFGANCRHSWNMFFEGASHMQYTEAQLEKMRSATCKYDGKEFKIYEARDKQRAMERGIKSTKRKLICFDEAIKNAPDEKAKAEFKNEFANLSVKLKKQEAKLNDFTYQTGLKRDRVREQVYAEETKTGIKNFGKSVSQKAVWANEKQKLPNYKNAIIPDEKINGYALNKNHPSGKNKAIAFEQYLGYNNSNSNLLIEEIRKLTSENPAVLRFSDEYGDRYEIKALMDGVSGKTANVKIAYIVQKDGTARLTSVYVAK